MNVWIVTIGNSDVQLKHNYEESNEWSNRSKNPEIRSKLKPFGVNDFKPSLPQNWSNGDPFTVPARAMGIVYGTNLDDQVFKDLHFPLLDTFTKYLQDKNRPDKIIVILTNQNNVFDNKNRNKKSPYWQDTCTLQPILEKYFEKKYPQLKTNEHIHYLPLEPKPNEKGLDNWNECLTFVNKLFKRSEIKSISKSADIYVSHQAGTPAISSAVQFTSLANFEKKVKFLVSNEYEQENAIPIPSSSYLQGIKLQEAKELLERYDYSGVYKIFFQEILKDKPLNAEEQKIKDLLAIAIQWNNANFDEFGKAISKRDKNAQERTKNFWWISYESAYLAVIRFEQDNNVEALFHSFRSVEGILRDMAGITNDNIPYLMNRVLSNWQLSEDMKVFNNHTREQRNNLFHNLLGLEKKQVFDAWKTTNSDRWKDRVIGCLNFISGEKFTSLKKASLMSSLHEELTTAINNYELQNVESTTRSPTS